VKLTTMLGNVLYKVFFLTCGPLGNFIRCQFDLSVDCEDGSSSSHIMVASGRMITDHYLGRVSCEAVG